MSLVVSCTCGESYKLKQEFAGRLVKCPSCGAEIRAAAIERRAQADPAFDRDQFLLRQQHLAINQKYHVWDEEGNAIMFVERPTHLLRTILVALAAVFGGVILVLSVVLAGVALAKVSPALAVAGATLAAAVGLCGLLAVIVWLSPKRHVTFYRDESKTERLLDVLQDHKFWLIKATYTIRDAAGERLGVLHKNYLYNFFRKRWDCIGPDGAMICVAREDSLLLSLLRRWIGPLLGVLRANFLIFDGDGDSDRVIGEFNRKFTILDRYALDLRADPQRTLDRRIALALGVMLDTGERR
ncbi:MAG TPA: hypothetical protein VMV10_18390 [Pirellulales bacterium]|nr:hypothetical protein [Pirellulales bacterium]